jgi:hypothetical protein
VPLSPRTRRGAHASRALRALPSPGVIAASVTIQSVRVPSMMNFQDEAQQHDGLESEHQPELQDPPQELIDEVCQELSVFDLCRLFAVRSFNFER